MSSSILPSRVWITAELGISKERARQIESRALGKLRRYAGEAEFLLTSA